MAGRPQTRVRKLAEALKTAGIDPADVPNMPGNVEELDPTRAHDARARTHARTHAKPTPIGPETRRAIDERMRDDLGHFAEALRPGLTVRLERTRPTWAAGWVEDLPLDDEELTGVLEYISNEHGGQLYRATVLAPDGSQLYVAKIPIAGPPRRRGNVQSREAWEGLPEVNHERAQPIAQPVAQPQGLDFKDMLEMFRMLRDESDKRETSILGAVKEMTQQSAASVDRLVGAVMQRDQEQVKRGGLREQLKELREAKDAIDDIAEVFGTTDHPQPQEERGAMDRALETAAAEMLVTGLKNDMAAGSSKRNAPQRPPAPGFRRVRPKPATPPQAK